MHGDKKTGLYIKSPSNPIIKYVNSLKKRAVREKEGMVLVEGARSVLDAEKNGAKFSVVLLREGYDGNVPKGDKACVLAPALFDKTAETVTPQGIMAVARIKTVSLSDISGGLYVICDNVRDPGNMGTIIRTAHAAGAAAVLITAGCVDPFNSKAVRASMGSVFAVPVAPVKDVSELKSLKRFGVKIAGGDVHEGAVPLYKAELTGKWAFVVGSEASGISGEVLGVLDERLIIPMPGGTESLNASAACAVMLYEYLRQNQE